MKQQEAVYHSFWKEINEIKSFIGFHRQYSDFYNRSFAKYYLKKASAIKQRCLVPDAEVFLPHIEEIQGMICNLSQIEYQSFEEYAAYEYTCLIDNCPIHNKNAIVIDVTDTDHMSLSLQFHNVDASELNSDESIIESLIQDLNKQVNISDDDEEAHCSKQPVYSNILELMSLYPDMDYKLDDFKSNLDGYDDLSSNNGENRSDGSEDGNIEEVSSNGHELNPEQFLHALESSSEEMPDFGEDMSNISLSNLLNSSDEDMPDFMKEVLKIIRSEDDIEEMSPNERESSTQERFEYDSDQESFLEDMPDFSVEEMPETLDESSIADSTEDDNIEEISTNGNKFNSPEQFEYSSNDQESYSDDKDLQPADDTEQIPLNDHESNEQEQSVYDSDSDSFLENLPDFFVEHLLNSSSQDVADTLDEISNKSQSEDSDEDDIEEIQPNDCESNTHKFVDDMEVLEDSQNDNDINNTSNVSVHDDNEEISSNESLDLPEPFEFDSEVESALENDNSDFWEDMLNCFLDEALNASSSSEDMSDYDNDISIESCSKVNDIDLVPSKKSMKLKAPEKLNPPKKFNSSKTSKYAKELASSSNDMPDFVADLPDISIDDLFDSSCEDITDFLETTSKRSRSEEDDIREVPAKKRRLNSPQQFKYDQEPGPSWAFM